MKLAGMAGPCAPTLAAFIAMAASSVPAPLRAETPAFALPPYTQAYEPQGVDERGLWMEADEDERRLRDSPRRIRDEKLEGYVHTVLCRTVGVERCGGIRIYVMDVPEFNAETMPNGAIMVFSGLLLRARNEGELAAVLGHEFAHFELRHGVEGAKNHQATRAMVAWLGVFSRISTTSFVGTQVALMGNTYRFSRAQEAQADLLGVKYMATSGYPARSAIDLWKSSIAEDDATARGRKQSVHHSSVSGFFDTHPASVTRVAYLTDAARQLPIGGDDRAQAYREAIKPFLPRLLADQVRLNDFGGTDYILSNLAAQSGWTPDLLFARAEMYRFRANPRDLQLAVEFYGQAKSAGYAGADLDRNNGLALLRNGQTTAGRAALKAYLAAQPDASDAKAIAALIED